MSVCSEAKYSCILKHDNLEAIKRCFVLIKNCHNPHMAHVQQCAHYTVMGFAENWSDRKLDFGALSFKSPVYIYGKLLIIQFLESQMPIKMI